MLAEIAYGLDVLGLDGVLLNSNSVGHYFGQPFYEPVLAELDRRQVPVLVHPTDCPHVDVLGFGRPSSVCEYPFDTGRNIVNALYSGVFRRHPRLRLILAHCGGALPSLGWRIAEHTTMGRGPEDAAIDPGHVAEVLRRLYYGTALAGAAHSLLPTLQVTDAAHMLFGTPTGRPLPRRPSNATPATWCTSRASARRNWRGWSGPTRPGSSPASPEPVTSWGR